MVDREGLENTWEWGAWWEIPKESIKTLYTHTHQNSPKFINNPDVIAILVLK